MNHMTDCSPYSNPWDEQEAMERDMEEDEYYDEVEADDLRHMSEKQIIDSAI